MPFSEIYGHEKQLELIRQALALGRIPHAFLFHGIPGIGKRKIAVCLAQALNCLETSLKDDFCGVCLSCRKIAQGIHPDLFLVEPEGQFIRIEKIRDMQEKMLFKPLEGRVQFFLITDADRLNSAAANALLKTLEEPLPGNVLVLTCTRVYQLPLTIISRCQQIRFHPLPQKQVMDYLRQEKGLVGEPAKEIACLAAGSIGRVNKVLDPVEKRRRGELGALFLKEFPAGLGNIAEVLGQEKEEIVENLLFWKSLLRDALVYKTLQAKDLLLNSFALGLISSCAERFDEEALLHKIELLDKTIWAIEHNANRQLTLDALLVKITQ